VSRGEVQVCLVTSQSTLGNSSSLKKIKTGERTYPEPLVLAEVGLLGH